MISTFDGIFSNILPFFYGNSEMSILTLTDPVGNTTSYTYNYMGLVATETNEKNATRYYSYDALGRLVSKTDRNGRITTYTYDTIGRLTAENWSDTTNYFMYTYDAVGNLLYATDGQHSYSYAYDALNRPIYTTFNFDSQSAVFAYTYDLAGRRTSSSLSLNGHSDRVNQVTYDFLGNATKINQTGSAVDEIFAEFDYNANGLMTSVKRYEVDGNNLINEIAESLYTYNANNAVTSITHKNPNGTQIVQHSYTYDETNNIVEYLNSIDGQTSYDYDFLGQLIGADYANGSISDENYTYDENGNRVTANGNTYTTGDNNELTSDGTWTYTYDAEGNRISKTNSTNRELYTWDHRNRLTSVTQQEWDSTEQEWVTVQTVEYAYDYNNVWIRKTVGNNSTIFIPENYQTTVQIDNGTVSHHYLWTPNQQDKLLADTTPTGISWALTDHLGTIRDILGATATHLIYDAFGNLTSGTNLLLFGYTGKPFDTATNLQNNINRWYDPSIGRWLSADPIGFHGNDTNLYRYVKNTSTLLTDYNGLETKSEIVTKETIVGYSIVAVAAEIEVEFSLLGLYSPSPVGPQMAQSILCGIAAKIKVVKQYVNTDKCGKKSLVKSVPYRYDIVPGKTSKIKPTRDIVIGDITMLGYTIPNLPFGPSAGMKFKFFITSAEELIATQQCKSHCSKELRLELRRLLNTLNK